MINIIDAMLSARARRHEERQGKHSTTFGQDFTRSARAEEGPAYEEPAAEYNSLSKSFSVLGVSQGASLAQIKSAYRTLVKKYHPDRAKRQGVSEKFASERFRQIQEAYEEILRSRE